MLDIAHVLRQDGFGKSLYREPTISKIVGKKHLKMEDCHSNYLCQFGVRGKRWPTAPPFSTPTWTPNMKIHNNECQSQSSTRWAGKGSHLEADADQRNRPDHPGATGNLLGKPSATLDGLQPAAEIRIANALGYYVIEPEDEDPAFRAAMDRQLAEAKNGLSCQ